MRIKGSREAISFPADKVWRMTSFLIAMPSVADPTATTLFQQEQLQQDDAMVAAAESLVRPCKFVCREAFVACPGYVLVGVDYSQIELRLLAHVSGDKKMLGILRAGGDIIKGLAAEWLGVSEEEIDTEQRAKAKKLVYSIIYGKSDFGLASELGVKESEARYYSPFFAHVMISSSSSS